jgi:hypothetical protein
MCGGNSPLRRAHRREFAAQRFVALLAGSQLFPKRCVIHDAIIIVSTLHESMSKGRKRQQFGRCCWSFGAHVGDDAGLLASKRQLRCVLPARSGVKASSAVLKNQVSYPAVAR